MLYYKCTTNGGKMKSKLRKEDLAKEIIQKIGGTWKEEYHIGSGQVSYDYLKDLNNTIKSDCIIDTLRKAQEKGVKITIKRNSDGSIEYSTK